MESFSQNGVQSGITETLPQSWVNAAVSLESVQDLMVSYRSLNLLQPDADQFALGGRLDLRSEPVGPWECRGCEQGRIAQSATLPAHASELVLASSGLELLHLCR